MPPKSARRSTARRAAPVDRIGALPDGVLHQILSLLPAHEAVQTCVLAQRWRDLWRSAPGIHFAGDKWWLFQDRFDHFVEHMLRLRGQESEAPLDSCCFEVDSGTLIDLRTLPSRWISLALRCNVRVLQFFASKEDYFVFRIDNAALVSQHLTKIELSYLIIWVSVLDLSGCTALVELKMDSCIIGAGKISSPSVKHLSMTSCEFTGTGPAGHNVMSFPGVVSLELIQCAARTPLLESMPSLQTANVSFGEESQDQCKNGGPGDCVSFNCGGCSYYKESPGYSETHDGLLINSLILKGLSQATDLQLSAYPSVFVFYRDIKWCPIFTNLKTLLLNEWCIAPDPNALICILQHSPILEKLNLQISKQGPRILVTKKGSFKSLELPFASGHLKSVQIKCEEIDDKVRQFLKLLSNYGIPLGHIQIQQSIGCSGSRYCNFVCTGFSNK